MQQTPRRSPRIACLKGEAPKKTPKGGIKQRFRALSGRILNCSPLAASAYKAPSVEPATDVSELKNNKRKPEIGTTPLRIDTGHMLTSTCKEPRSSVPFNFCGLPEEVKIKYCTKRKITDLYDWQKECLSNHQLLRGSNCIVSLPTGAGKTLIAEILMLREAILNKRSSVLVLPYVAIVQEKINSLAFFEEEFNIRVEEYAASKGRIPPIKRRNRHSIYVATIEKANMIINSLIETEHIDSVGLLVIDELHMIGEGHRGAILEQQLTKFQFKGSGQIVGISATLSNMPEMAKFLGSAFVYSTNFRPVELVEFIKLDNGIYKIHQGEIKWEADLPQNNNKMDPDGVIQLLQNIVPNNSVIIFCPTKKNCENVAKMIASCAPKHFRERKSQEKVALIAAIKEDGDGNIDADLENCLKSGIAYHHSGLTHDERKHIESAYSEGILFIICATSTLAAGVNLPARRVIIKTPLVGINPLSKAQYLQMVGRAGRPGFDVKGDSVTIVRRGQQERQFREMLASPMLSCVSSLMDSEALMSFILDILVLKMANNIDGIMHVLEKSLLLAQKGFTEVQMAVRSGAEELISRGMLKLDEGILNLDDDSNIVSTPLGNSTFDANIEPNEVKRLEADLLQTMTQGIVLTSHFHLLHTITPVDQACEVKWEMFHDEYRLLPQSEKNLLMTLGVSESSIIKAITARKRLNAGDPAMRLYIALMLKKIWDQEKQHIVAEKFEVERGWLQTVLQSSISRASAIARFSEKQANMWPFRLLLPELVQRLSDCAHVELIPLLGIDGVKRGRAFQLYSAGFKNVAAVAKAEYQDLVASIENLRTFQAIKIIRNARAHLRDQLDAKMEEIEAIGVDMKDLPL